jgi:hypothetical protein
VGYDSQFALLAATTVLPEPTDLEGGEEGRRRGCKIAPEPPAVGRQGCAGPRSTAASLRCTTSTQVKGPGIEQWGATVRWGRDNLRLCVRRGRMLVDVKRSLRIRRPMSRSRRRRRRARCRQRSQPPSASPAPNLSYRPSSNRRRGAPGLALLGARGHATDLVAPCFARLPFASSLDPFLTLVLCATSLPPAAPSPPIPHSVRPAGCGSLSWSSTGR